MSSKLILIILSYTVSKLGHFRHSVHALIIKTNSPIDNYRCLIIVIHLRDKHNSAKTKQGNYFVSMSSLIKRKLYHTSNRFLVSVSKAMFSFYYDKNRNTLVNTWPASGDTAQAVNISYCKNNREIFLINLVVFSTTILMGRSKETSYMTVETAV